MEENIDFKGAFDKIQEMLGSDEGKKQIQGIFDMFSSDEPSSNRQNEENERYEGNEENGGFDLDPMMLLRLGKILSASQKEQNEKTRLLNSLKPFLKENRRSKVDNAIKIMNMTRIFTMLREK